MKNNQSKDMGKKYLTVPCISV